MGMAVMIVAMLMFEPRIFMSIGTGKASPKSKKRSKTAMPFRSHNLKTKTAKTENMASYEPQIMIIIVGFLLIPRILNVCVFA